MISPETLRRYPFFGSLTGDQLRALAMFSDEVGWEAEGTVFEAGQEATHLYLLKNGSVELYYVVADERNPGSRKEYFICQVNPGELFGVSALLEPHELTATAIASRPSSAIRLDGKRLLDLSRSDPDVGCKIMHELARSIYERLRHTRVQLAAAHA